MMNFQVMAKPSGASCNLRCSYCFYLEKANLYEGDGFFRMGEEVLESFIRQYISSQDSSEVHFAWQGGEPTLLGVDYFRLIVSLQKRYAGEKRVSNSIQTNGTLINDEWAGFLKENNFLVGVSIDGPRNIHDSYRIGIGGGPTFDKVSAALSLLKDYCIPYNTLTVINNLNAEHPMEVYHFLKEVGDRHMQFIPAVERQPGKESEILGLDLAIPPAGKQEVPSLPMANWSVSPVQLAKFYTDIFNEWIHNDVGEIFVQFFDVALGNWLGASAGLCQFQQECGMAGALEHNGDLYSCDHYVYPDHKLGNIIETPLAEMMMTHKQRSFGQLKFENLPERCLQCEVRSLCNGDCPKHRFVKSPDEKSGVSYLCEGYRQIFNHIVPYLKLMSNLIESGRPVPLVMDVLKQGKKGTRLHSAGRNLPCRCGSGQKYKRCCGRL